jgi:hypothetical protein
MVPRITRCVEQWIDSFFVIDAEAQCTERKVVIECEAPERDLLRYGGPHLPKPKPSGPRERAQKESVVGRKTPPKWAAARTRSSKIDTFVQRDLRDVLRDQMKCRGLHPDVIVVTGEDRRLHPDVIFLDDDDPLVVRELEV